MHPSAPHVANVNGPARSPPEATWVHATAVAPASWAAVAGTVQTSDPSLLFQTRTGPMRSEVTTRCLDTSCLKKDMAVRAWPVRMNTGASVLSVVTLRTWHVPPASAMAILVWDTLKLTPTTGAPTSSCSSSTPPRFLRSHTFTNRSDAEHK